MRAVSDGITGWATIRGNQGTEYLVQTTFEEEDDEAAGTRK